MNRKISRIFFFCASLSLKISSFTAHWGMLTTQIEFWFNLLLRNCFPTRKFLSIWILIAVIYEILDCKMYRMSWNIWKMLPSLNYFIISILLALGRVGISRRRENKCIEHWANQVFRLFSFLFSFYSEVFFISGGIPRLKQLWCVSKS